ncbi:ATP-binding protein [Arcicella rigui]|uniref:ATP-binding protein n=1 Tax=Arcicella rigui TaxID=797020 RepID=A0ABU5QGC3_9BACT|nr:ATP-binding protein [Arcicella rigui]MEA5141918.1 ATP-binding protein [Arcicella rigui]
MISRFLTQQLIEYLRFFPVLGIVGPRQVGKTTLAKLLMQSTPKESIYFDLENPQTYEQIQAQPVWFFSQFKDKTVIIDEVQLMLPLFPLLRSLIDEYRVAGRFILLGSASPEFLATSQETLAGRIAFQELSTLALSEVKQMGINQKVSWFRGGFPDAILAPEDKFWWAWQQNYIKSYAERDLALLGVAENPIVLQRLLRMLASLHGSLLNVSSLSNSLQIEQRKLKKYLNLLEQSFLIRSLAPWSVNISKRLIKSPKIYFRDTGNLHYLLNLSSYESLVENHLIGNSWEGYVIEQVCKQLKDDVVPYFYRTSNGAEIDLVLVRGIKPIVAIEIKLSTANSLKKGSTEAINDLATQHNFIVTTEGGNFYFRPQWMVCNVPEIIQHLIDLELCFQYNPTSPTS